MSAKKTRDYGRTATALLATAYVLVTGLGVCLLIVLTNADRGISWQLAVLCVSGAVFLWFLLWLLRDRPSNSSSLTNVIWLGRKEEAREEIDYKPRLRRRRAPDGEFGKQNQPPSVERIRELSENVKTWVPSRHRAERHRRDQEGR